MKKISLLIIFLIAYCSISFSQSADWGGIVRLKPLDLISGFKNDVFCIRAAVVPSINRSLGVPIEIDLLSTKKGEGFGIYSGFEAVRGGKRERNGLYGSMVAGPNIIFAYGGSVVALYFRAVMGYQMVTNFGLVLTPAIGFQKVLSDVGFYVMLDIGFAWGKKFR
ncbi:MAG: hypothetical protein LBP67_04780 [Bacteroidales bacterium]|jgi:hypothetical protein|nr:hypothetical protein [Bacteroidales bacterium]